MDFHFKSKFTSVRNSRGANSEKLWEYNPISKFLLKIEKSSRFTCHEGYEGWIGVSNFTSHEQQNDIWFLTKIERKSFCLREFETQSGQLSWIITDLNQANFRQLA